MKTIQRKDFKEVGSAVKVHGTKGELKFKLTNTFKIKDWAFLEFRGKPVPFYLEHTKAEFDDEITLKLKGIDSIEQANAIIGKILLMPSKWVDKNDAYSDLDLIGYTLNDEELGVLGEIKDVIENTYQSLALVIYQNREVLIPLVEPIVTEIDDDTKQVFVNLPEGLIEIN
ncbi:MAG: ribosome maturation factor RimM [Bacteroidia bacterium]|nr:ribosome maturation factor RimM [Bacteroidia bacterium]